MTRASTRTNFHSSKLIRCLADLDMVEAVDHGDAFGEKLGLWVHFADAITLSAVHSDSLASQPTNQSGMLHEQPSGTRAAVAIEFDRIQAILVNSIKKSCSPDLGKAHMKSSMPNLELPMDPGTAYAPYARLYETHQRDMELSIQSLRLNVREALAKTSPRLRKLAELDATFEKILRDRERKLLSKIPVLLKKRFTQLFQAHQQKLADRQQPDNPADWMQAGGWLARFCNDMQMLLLAEMELRLHPAMGLIEALDNKIRNE